MAEQTNMRENKESDYACMVTHTLGGANTLNFTGNMGRLQILLEKVNMLNIMESCGIAAAESKTVMRL